MSYIIKLTYTGMPNMPVVYIGTTGVMSPMLDDFSFGGKYWRNLYTKRSTAQRIASKWQNVEDRDLQ